MIPLSALSKVSNIVGAEQLERYNGLISGKIFGSGAPGVSSGDAIKAVERIAKENLPDGYQMAWTAQAYQEKRTGSAAIFAFGFAIIMCSRIKSTTASRGGNDFQLYPFGMT